MVDFLDMTSKMVLNVISSVPLHSLGGKILIGRLLKSSIHPIIRVFVPNLRKMATLLVEKSGH